MNNHFYLLCTHQAESFDFICPAPCAPSATAAANRSARACCVASAAARAALNSALRLASRAAAASRSAASLASQACACARRSVGKVHGTQCVLQNCSAALHRHCGSKEDICITQE